jgi:hypothetical protein
MMDRHMSLEEFLDDVLPRLDYGLVCIVQAANKRRRALPPHLAR